MPHLNITRSPVPQAVYPHFNDEQAKAQEANVAYTGSVAKPTSERNAKTYLPITAMKNPRRRMRGR